MATIAEWKVIIAAKRDEEAALAGLTSTSNAAEHNMWIAVLAFVAWVLEGLFSSFKSDVNADLKANKAHRLEWYRTKALAFQYGVVLPDDSDVYETVPPEDESVLIVTQAAAVEVTAQNMVRVKAAKGEPGALEKLDSAEVNALSAYMARIKDAGVRLQVTSGDPDDLKLALEIFYDPLVINAAGERIDGATLTPAKDAINAFLANMSFNGVFILNDLQDAIEATEGLELCRVISASANYAATPYVPITYRYNPDAGYLVLNETYFDAEVVYSPKTW